MNTSDCENKIFQSNSSGTCNLTIYSKGNNDSLNILRGGDVKLAVHNEGKIWAKTGYGVHGSNWLYSARTDGVLGPADVGTWGDNNRGNNTKWFVNQ